MNIPTTEIMKQGRVAFSFKFGTLAEYKPH